MKIKLLLTTSFTIFCVGINAQTIFQKTFGTYVSESGNIVKQTQDKGYILATTQGYYVKTDSLGNKMWSKNINCPNLRDIIQTQDGGYLICGGFVYINGKNVPYLIKLNSSGNIVWQRAYNSWYANYLNFVQEDIDGTGYIAAGNDYDVYLMFMKVDLSGNSVWTHVMKPLGQNNNDPKAWEFVQIKSDSSFFVLSSYRYGPYNEGILVSKFSKNGNYLWTKSLSTSGMYPAWPHKALSIKETYNGNVMVSFLGTTLDFMEIDTSGTPVGNAIRYNLPQQYTTTGIGWDLAEPAINKTVFLSYTAPISYSNSSSEIVLLKNDISGNIVWCQKIGGVNDENSGKILTTNDGGAAIAGTTKSFSVGKEDVFFLKTDSLGTFFCNSDTFPLPSVQFPNASGTDFYYSDTAISFINIQSWNFIVTNSNDTSYDACICVPPTANFETNYPDQNYGGFIQENSTWATNWYWDYGNGQLDTTIIPSPNYGVVDSVYLVCLKVTNACGSDSLCDSLNYVFLDWSVHEDYENSVLNIFPNPFSSQTMLQVSIQLKNAALTVSNILGQTVKQIKNISGQSITFNRDNLQSGFYFIWLTQENTTIATAKLIIND